RRRVARVGHARRRVLLAHRRDRYVSVSHVGSARAHRAPSRSAALDGRSTGHFLSEGLAMSLKTVLSAIGGVGATLESRAPAARQAKPKGGASADVPSDPFADPRWSMLRDMPPEQWDLDAMYQAAGSKPTGKPFVAIAAPYYRESASIARVCMNSRNAARLDL